MAGYGRLLPVKKVSERISFNALKSMYFMEVHLALGRWFKDRATAQKFRDRETLEVPILCCRSREGVDLLVHTQLSGLGLRTLAILPHNRDIHLYTKYQIQSPLTTL